jgi:predicted AlkP superfamily pyrophosphatase or phosphodiesterase
MHALWTLAIAALLALSPACGSSTGKESTAAPARPESSSDQVVIVVSVDGMMPATYMDPDAHGLKVPTLRALKAGGAHSPGVTSVFPSVTYPAHTSIATGVTPAVHGITSNFAWDPLARNQEGWFWYTEDIKVPTIWQVARAAGIRTALINWPVTVGADVDFLVAEYWRAGTADDVKLSRALATRGLLDQVGERFPGFWNAFKPSEMPDSAPMDVAIHVLETGKPRLMLIHLLMVDEYQHRHGLWSAEARDKIEEADAQIGRLVQTLERLGMWQRTTLVVLSDHGFVPMERRVVPGVVLAQLGLLTHGKGNTLDDWKAVTRANGGMAYVYVKDADDIATRKAIEDAFAALAAQPGSGIGRIYTSDEIQARGGDPRAFLALEASAGFAFRDGYTGDLIVSSSYKGHHGFDPERDELRSSLIVHGPGIAPGPIEGARLIDVAPTVASRLGLALPRAQGRVLALPRPER